VIRLVVHLVFGLLQFPSAHHHDAGVNELV
jgi:hypothetical protein